MPSLKNASTSSAQELLRIGEVTSAVGLKEDKATGAVTLGVES